MTFEEKFKQNHPNSDFSDIKNIGCPRDWGYEVVDNLSSVCKQVGTCYDCWNRDTPETNKLKTFTKIHMDSIREVIGNVIIITDLTKVLAVSHSVYENLIDTDLSENVSALITKGFDTFTSEDCDASTLTAKYEDESPFVAAIIRDSFMHIVGSIVMFTGELNLESEQRLLMVVAKIIGKQL